MLKVLRTKEGASIFDLEGLVKVNIEEDLVFDWQPRYGEMGCYRVEFDTRLYDLLRGGGSTWFVKSLDVIKQTDSELAEIFGELFDKGREHIIQNRSTKIGNDNRTNHEAQHRYLYSNCEEINYFSEEPNCEWVPRLELMKVEDHGYSLSFGKATIGLAKLDFFLRRSHSRDPELARFYCDCFAKIIELGESGYQDYEDEMMDIFIAKVQQKRRDKVLAKRKD